jgi:hypothetical protein
MFGPRPDFPQSLDLLQQFEYLDTLLHRQLGIPPGLVHRLLPAGLRQLRMEVGDVEPLRLLVLVGVDQLVRQVLLRGVLAHMDAGPSNYSRVVGARLGLHAKEFSEQYPVGLDP